MMIGMPSASPLVLLYGVATKRSSQRTADARFPRSRQTISSSGRFQPWGNGASACACHVAARLTSIIRAIGRGEQA
jgi:hypothetical protein